MSESLSAVVKVASTPDQAKVFVAMLQAEGIPAFVDGGALTDEFAMSQRLMNASSVKVMVPASTLERAKEILQPVDVDPDELAEQALAATEDVQTPRPPRTESERPSQTALYVAVIAIITAFVFMGLWLAQVEQRGEDPLYRQEWTGQGWRTYLRKTNALLFLQEDQNNDGIIERIVAYSPTGSWKSTQENMDSDGFDRRVTIVRDNDLTETWTREDSTTPYDHGTVTDSEGKVYQTIEWQPHTGYIIKQP